MVSLIISTFLSGLGWLKSAANALWALVARYPRECIIAVLAGSLVWVWHGRSECRADAAAFKAQTIVAQDQADAAARAARAKWDASQKDKANEANRDYQTIRADGADRLIAYISTHRVQPSAQSSTGKVIAPAKDPDSTVPAIAPAETVMASVTDLRTCDADYAYAKAAYDWAHGLNEGN